MALPGVAGRGLAPVLVPTAASATANPQNRSEVDVSQSSAALVSHADAQAAFISVLERRSEIGLRLGERLDLFDPDAAVPVAWRTTKANVVLVLQPAGQRPFVARRVTCRTVS
jgi:hypothetical protein